MRMHRPLAAMAAFSLLVLGAEAPAPTIHGIDVAGIDRSVKPGDNFYLYANGTWLKNAEIPADVSSWGSFSKLYEETTTRNRALMEDATKSGAAAGSSERMVGDYYTAFLDEAGIEKAGLMPLEGELDAIDAIKTKADLAREIGATQRIDVDPMNNTNFHTEHLFGLWVAPGFDDYQHYTPYMLQGGLGLPDRDYYLTDNAKMAEIRTQYIAHIAAMLKLAGETDSDKKAQSIFDLEKTIAEASESRVDSEDVVKANNPWTRDDFAKKAPGFDWTAYFIAAGLTAQPNFIVWQPAAITGLAKIAGTAPLAVWKDYLTFHTLDHYAAFLPKPFDDASFDFYGHTLSGTPQQRERWKRAVSATNGALGDAVGELYVKRYFPPEAKATALAMVKNLLAAYHERLEKLAWMAPATKAEALKKVDGLYIGIGYPETWRDYSGLDIKPDDALGNEMRAELFDYRYWTARLGKNVDRSEWSMEPQTVNAVNLPLQNALNFPAAILQPPFFDADAPAAVNYGGIGAVIGHEISHSFDNQGAEFDAEGRLHNWWTKGDFAHFEASAAALAAQYDAYKPFPDLSLNGKLELGENIADVAGISASHDAWLMSLGGKLPKPENGFTADQQFFLSFGQIWRTKYREAALRRQILTNEHAPGEYRASTVRNIDAWYKAFDVKPGETLYLAPKDRVQVW